MATQICSLNTILFSLSYTISKLCPKAIIRYSLNFATLNCAHSSTQSGTTDYLKEIIMSFLFITFIFHRQGGWFVTNVNMLININLNINIMMIAL